MLVPDPFASGPASAAVRVEESDGAVIRAVNVTSGVSGSARFARGIWLSGTDDADIRQCRVDGVYYDYVLAVLSGSGVMIWDNFLGSSTATTPYVDNGQSNQWYADAAAQGALQNLLCSGCVGGNAYAQPPPASPVALFAYPSCSPSTGPSLAIPGSAGSVDRAPLSGIDQCGP